MQAELRCEVLYLDSGGGRYGFWSEGECWCLGLGDVVFRVREPDPEEALRELVWFLASEATARDLDQPRDPLGRVVYEVIRAVAEWGKES